MLHVLSEGPAVSYREKFFLIHHPDPLWSPHNDSWRLLPRDQSGQSRTPPSNQCQVGIFLPKRPRKRLNTGKTLPLCLLIQKGLLKLA
jgi:hypothetical protein